MFAARPILIWATMAVPTAESFCSKGKLRSKGYRKFYSDMMGTDNGTDRKFCAFVL